jgi:two-component system sensor kinase FixL
VVLMAGRFLQRPWVVFVGFACLALTILSYLLQHGDTYGPEFIRCLVSLTAIGITTFLALRIQSAGAVLRQQASLLESRTTRCSCAT